MPREDVDREGMFHVQQVIKCHHNQEVEVEAGGDFIRREAGKQAR
jgi:hypothetical protein